MFNNMKEKKLKYKIVNYFMTKGNKITCENILSKSFKLLQKLENKPHSEIIKLAILNATPIFRIMALQEKRKKKRKKGVARRAKEIPAFLSHYSFRSSWALKLISNSIKKQSNSKFFERFQQEIIFTANNTGETVKVKTEVQKQALKKKYFFKYYRW